MSSVRVRMAPSPTGWIHIGTARTFLFDYFMARQNPEGKLILRIEDTDQKRSVPGGIESLIESLSLLGITPDEGEGFGGEYGPYTQTDRKEIYAKYAQKLLGEGNAYYCFCSKERLEKLRTEQESMKQKTHYDGHCKKLSKEEVKTRIDNGEPYVIRMKVPENENIEFTDLVFGKISFSTNEVDEQVIIKSSGIPTYHFAVVVDDVLMKITHILRGVEWLSSTPKHVLLYKYLGETPPIFVHVPLILNPDGKGKLSKRKGNVAVLDFFRAGYIREGLVNFLSLIGWNPAPELAHKDEIYDIDFLTKNFDAKRIRRASGRFQIEKLDSINAVWIGRLTKEELYARVMQWVDLVMTNNVVDSLRGETDELKAIRGKVSKLKSYFEQNKVKATELLGVTQQRIKKLTEIYDWLSVLWDDSGFDNDSVNTALPDVEKRTEIIYNLREALEKLTTWSQEEWEPAIRALADKFSLKHGDLFMVLRVIVTGKKISPPLREFMEIAGREFVSKRFDKFSKI
ncbi:glutamate--tRNA ligase [bacterium]|nr:glutamate--tRNA ligase [bacterium]